MKTVKVRSGLPFLKAADSNLPLQTEVWSEPIKISITRGICEQRLEERMATGATVGPLA